ncbi:MAG: beta-glucosidase [Rhodothermaceae bacterium]|nr:MAG: beta-glucosidase [Rhodothermaceae bacterium]
MSNRTTSLFLILFLLIRPELARGQHPYRDPGLPVEVRVEDLLGRMTLEEKFWQLFMIPGDLDEDRERYRHGLFGFQVATAGKAGDAFEQQLEYGPSGTARQAAEKINAIQRYFVEETRLGIPIIPFDEALHGLVREGATAFPQAIALAATWDTALVGRVARAIARETRTRGIRQVLSPVLNLARDVRWGRVEETYGEDPYLTSMMGLAFVRAFEQAGVVTTPKHFVANVGAGGRDSYPIYFSERLLDEVYFPAFKTAIRRGGARSVMMAYNAVDGVPATANRWLMRERLKQAWGFDGFIISDANATGGAIVLHHTAADYADAAAQAIEAGLDVIFQTAYEHHRLFWPAFEQGLIAPATLDDAVRRVLRAKFELGLFEDPYVDPEEAARWNGHADHRALAREAARASIVLLKNESRVLPLDPGIESIAVIGTDAVEARLGGYSGPGIDKVSILEGLRQRLGGARVHYAPGPGRETIAYVPIPPGNLFVPGTPEPQPGLAAAYFDNNRLEGDPVVRRTDEQINFGWTLHGPAPELPYDWYSARWETKLRVPEPGTYRIGLEGNDGFRLYLDDALLIDNWKKQSYRTILKEVTLTRPVHDLRVEYFESTGNARLKLVWDYGLQAREAEARIAEAVAAARQSEVAVVVAGIEEGEFRDRASLRLPGHQEALIRAVAATGRPTVVVIVGGSAVTMTSWLDDVAGVLYAWYPGEAGGLAVADVLFGDYNPAGRLPITFPVSEGQLPLYYNHAPTGRGDDYLDLTGQPLFPFGFGLSYTTFAYSNLRIEPNPATPGGASLPGPVATIRCTVRNTGPRAGDEVVQLYLRDVLASTARPVMELKGFQRIHLAPGEAKDVTFELTPEHLQMLNRDGVWVVEPGTFRIMIGRSSKDIRLRGMLEVR